MNFPKNDSISSRLATASDARKAMLKRFAQRPDPNDPEVQKRAAERLAIAAAREARQEERKAAKAAEAERQVKLAEEKAAEARAQAARDAEAAAEMEARALDLHERAAMAEVETKARALALAAEQKAARDARYAARQARRR